MKKLCIIGAGGFGRQAMCVAIDNYEKRNNTRIGIEFSMAFMVDDIYFEKHYEMNIPIIKRSEMTDEFHYVAAVGDPELRRKLIGSISQITSLVSHRATLYSCDIKEGAIVMPGVIATCNITIGRHAILNLNTTIGHDCTIGDFFTTAHGVHLGGNCVIGDNVYMGLGTVVKQETYICSNVTIGMGSVVVKNILEPGIYFGNPLKKYK